MMGTIHILYIHIWINKATESCGISAYFEESVQKNIRDIERYLQLLINQYELIESQQVQIDNMNAEIKRMNKFKE